MEEECDEQVLTEVLFSSPDEAVAPASSDDRTQFQEPLRSVKDKLQISLEEVQRRYVTSSWASYKQQNLVG